MTTKQEVVYQLSNLPGALYEQEKKLLDMNTQLDSVETLIGNIEAQTASKVNQMSLSEEFKAMLSNEQKRKQKLVEMLGLNNEYVDAAKKMVSLKNERAALTVELNHNDRRFKAARAMAVLVGEEN